MLGKWSYVAVDLGGGRMTEGLRDSHRTDQVPEGPCSVEVSPRRWGRVSPKVGLAYERCTTRCLTFTAFNATTVDRG